MDSIPSTPATTFIYALLDPETLVIRYIGKADDPTKRLRGHLNDYRKTRKVSWIRSLRARKLTPILQILEEVPFDQWKEREAWWIEHHRSLGTPLTNTRDGGDGGINDPDVLARAAAKKRGRRHTEEHRAKISAGCKGHFVSEASRERWRQLGREKSPETRAKISAAQTGRTMSPKQ